MKPSVYGTVRKMLKAENDRYGKYSTRSEVLEKVEGNRKTVERAYRAIKAEIREETRKAEEVAEAVISIEAILEEYRTKKMKEEMIYTWAIVFSIGFLLGALLFFTF